MIQKIEFENLIKLWALLYSDELKKKLDKYNKDTPIIHSKEDINYGVRDYEKGVIRFNSKESKIELVSDNESWIRNVYNISEVAQAVTYAPYKYKIKPGESLEYKVKYGFITLGWLKIRMQEAVIINGKTVYPIQFHIDSNPSFDFMISLHHIYESYIEAESLNAIRTRLYTEGDEIYLARLYNFDYDQSRFQAQIIYSDGRFAKVEKDLPSMAQDGTSMLYFARGIVSNQSGGSTTVVIDEEYKYEIHVAREVVELCRSYLLPALRRHTGWSITNTKFSSTNDTYREPNSS